MCHFCANVCCLSHISSPPPAARHFDSCSDLDFVHQFLKHIWKIKSQVEQQQSNISNIQSFMASVSMYCFLCFILLMGVEVQTGNVTENGNKTMQASIPPSKPNPSSLTSNKSGEGNPTSEPTSGKPTTRSQQTIPSTTSTASPNSQNSNCHLCVEDLLKPLPLIVIGALGITCFILLMTTLVLACHMCCLKRQISRGYQVCSDTTQSAVQPTMREASVDCEQRETRIMLDEIRNGKPEGEEIQAEPKEPEKPEEAAKEVQEAEVTNQDTTEDFTQNEMPEAESPPDQDFPAPIEDTV